METNIAILSGNGIHNLAYSTRSRLHLEGYKVVAINNFSNFGFDRTIIYCRRVLSPAAPFCPLNLFIHSPPSVSGIT